MEEGCFSCRGSPDPSRVPSASKKLLPTPQPLATGCFVNILETFCFPVNQPLSPPTATQENLAKFLDQSSYWARN